MIGRQKETASSLPPMARPHFLILGCQKGGTTTLYDLICQHPRIEEAVQKELQFFTFNYDNGWGWYRKQMPIRRTLWQRLRERPLCGEATPYYLFHPLAAERIADRCPHARLVVLLRDPVERSLSQYFHSVRLGLESLSLSDAIAAEPDRLADAESILQLGKRHQSHQEHSYLSRSRYGHQLERYAKRFPQQQLLVLSSEAFFSDPNRTTQQVWHHLGLEQHQQEDRPALNQSRGEAHGVSPSQREQLTQTLAGEADVVKQWLASHGPEAHGL